MSVAVEAPSTEQAVLLAKTSEVAFLDVVGTRLVAIHSHHVPEFPFSRVLTNWSNMQNVLTLDEGSRVLLDDHRLSWAGGSAGLRVPRDEARQATPTPEPRRLAQLIALCGRYRASHDTAVQLVNQMLDAVDGPSTARAFRSLIGRGPGLTPSGDDVLLGAMAGGALLGGWPDFKTLRPVIGRALGEPCARTTRVSQELLECALDGRFPPVLVDVCRSVDIESDLTPGEAVQRLLRVGATSGSDMILGLWVSLTGPRVLRNTHGIR